MSGQKAPPGDPHRDDIHRDGPPVPRFSSTMSSNSGPLPMVVAQPSSDMHKSFHQNFPKQTLSRAIAPAPVGQSVGSLAASMAHTLGGSTAAIPGPVLKKAVMSSATDASHVQTGPLTLTTATSTSSLPLKSPAGAAMQNVVQISSASTSPAISTLQVPLIRGSPVPSLPLTPHTHLPLGAIAASALSVKHGQTMISLPRPTTPAAIPMPVSGAHGVSQSTLHPQIRGSLLPQTIKTAAPPTNRSTSPAVSAGERQRPSISLHNVATTAPNSSIQITLQAQRSGLDGPAKVTSSYPSPKVHLNQQGLNLHAQGKSAISQSPSTQNLHHPLIAATTKPTKGSTMPTVTVSLATTAVTIPIISTGTAIAPSIPIAKVPPQRQQQQQQQSHVVTSTSQVSQDQLRPDSGSFPQPQPAHSHNHPQTHGAGLSQSHSVAHCQSSASIFIPQPQRVGPSSTLSMSLASSVGHSDSRDRMPLPFSIPPYMLSPENPYYQQLMHYQVAAAHAQAQAQIRPSFIPSQSPSPSLAATLAAGAHTSQNIRFSQPQMVVTVPDPLRPHTPGHSQFQSSEGSIMGVSATDSLSTGSSPMQITTVAAVASSLYTAGSIPPTIPQIGQQAPATPNSTQANSLSGSPRPSILRKRTNEGVANVKKQLVLGSNEIQSPRQESRPDPSITPQSNTSSPKTPASIGESQSSTDTALSSEGTTPTQNSQGPGEIKIKLEPPDTVENGYMPINQSNSVEASPRKKPRKQLLHATEELKNTSSEDEFEKLLDIKEERHSFEEIKQELQDEYIDEEGIRWTIEKQRPPITLMNFYNISWKPRNNHFQRYSDVKPKEERRPTVNELSNQRGVTQKASGWKLFHMAAQLEDLVELEKSLCQKLTVIQTTVAPKAPLKHSVMENETAMLHELTQGNIQRCKLIMDQLSEAKTSMLKVLDHKSRIFEIINKHMSKRPIKKKER
ncbi:hypothetical protein CHS0354_002382 [Potamilus streckersoni]|uniref:Histone deacetylase complex subunit SAP130 C-terminal domain-containing protein n=1 Tax=Potamilus streckersoni TaxID=2493646 RepID=A0AAE0TF39_9BIVA|nr:hypothetical protein CHS0354_002382 [Potamilus streckersoni]